MTAEKWTAKDYNNRKLLDWSPPHFTYPCSDKEHKALWAIKHAFDPLPVYNAMEKQAITNDTLVSADIPIPENTIAFLENTAEKCTSPTTKHSRAGMNSAKHWVQRLDTPAGMFRRLTDGYGISLMFGERYHQFIRNGHNWRGSSGFTLDPDVWHENPDTLSKKLEAEGKTLQTIEAQLAKNETYPKPVYSMEELLERYPLLSRICRFILPTASSLYKGRAFLARGIVLFPKHLTDKRAFRKFGDVLLGQIDCLPANVTKNPLAVGFGNTHNAPYAHDNPEVDTQWIIDTITTAKESVRTESSDRKQQDKARAERREQWEKQHPDTEPRNIQQNSTGGIPGENITAFIENCDALGEMVALGWLTQGKNNEYRWHEASSDRSCELYSDGILWIFSHTMSTRSPGAENEPVNAHRFYLYQLTGLDLAKDSDKPEIRDYLFSKGYGEKTLRHRRQKAKLLQVETEAKPTETLDENRTRREAATDDYLSTEPNDTEQIHILLVSDGTGAGKTYTLVGKAREHNRRTLTPLPYTELAQQAVEVAYEHGFKDPYHLKGREHNWNESGIEKIPVGMRTADLFEKNNCIMVDEVKKYTDKRLAPRTYCEHKCPFRVGCPHLAQYEGLGKRDFIASCSPNLLFDLNQRGYLNAIVNAISEPTDTDMAMDAILGTTSEPTEPFDFAIVDDYSISGLYTDITFVESEFKAIKKAWHGTPTATFAKGILKAFEKKKPHKILKALRTALEEAAPHTNEIATALTQHARRGTIEYSDTLKANKETQEILTEKEIRYTDGGRQFIPVDTEAYQYLKGKAIPCINPDHIETDEVGQQVVIPHAPVKALIAGVQLSELTPVWRKGATPIDLIEIFSNSVRNNPKNAPITRGYRTGEPPVPVLTFSIPPQAPVGILPQIAMLSATTNTDDTQHAFEHQPVHFSEHIGGNLEWAPGVNVYQFQDARLTSASVFEYRKDTDGKRILQEAPIGLTPTAAQRLEKLNAWASQVDGLTAFISYKEFTKSPFEDVVSDFDIVTHFDQVAGLNFDGIKYLVIFGYPKVDHEVVMTHARKQHAADSEPLPKGSYDELTETAPFTQDGITITETRYKDPRLEKVRNQLATEKLQQAIGRARLATWRDTQTIIFTTAPASQITDRATLFSDEAFNLAEAPSELPQAMQRIQDAIETGDVQAVMETTGVSKSTAERKTKPARAQLKVERDAQIIALHDQGLSQREIEKEMKASGNKVSNGTIRNVLQARKKRQDQLDILIGDDAFCAPSETMPSKPIVQEVNTLRDTPEFDNIIRKFAAQSCICFCFSDHKMHTAAEIAERTFIVEPLIESVLSPWYENVMISPGIGKSYWMTDSNIQKCRDNIEKEKYAALQRYLDECAPLENEKTAQNRF